MDELQNASTVGGILIGVISILLVLAGIIGLVYYYRVKKADLTAHLNNLELDKQQQLLELEIRSQEVVRERISGDLHDSMGSLLFATKVSAAFLQTFIKGNPEAEEINNEIIENMNKGMVYVRELALEIAPTTFTNKGLSQSIHDFCLKMNSRQITIQLIETGNKFIWNCERALQVYRIFQELMYNSYKHSGTDKTLVFTKWGLEKFEIRVIDYGIGLTSVESSNGLGFWNIKIRVRHLDGDFTIVNNFNEPGTTATVVIPY